MCLFILYNDNLIHLTVIQGFRRWYFRNLNFEVDRQAPISYNISLCVFRPYKELLCQVLVARAYNPSYLKG
jgi:hypothetical protein